MDGHVSIIILNYNGTQDTLACLTSLAHTTYPNFTVILIDNASRLEEETLLRTQITAFPFVHYIANQENLGFTGGCNQGMRLALDMFQSEYIYLLNNDTVVDPAFLTEAVAQCKKNPKIGIVASQSRLFSDPLLLDNAGHDLLDCGDVIPRGRNLSVAEYAHPTLVMGACGAGMLVPTHVLRSVGLLSEEFFINYEDVDFCLRAIMYGWDCVYVPTSIIHHKINASIGKVRTYTFNVRSQLNQLRAYYYNMPLPALLWNTPSILLRECSVILVNLLFLRFTLLRVFLHARLLFLKDLPRVSATRKKHRPHWKRNSWYMITHQRFFLVTYIGYFRTLILQGKKSALE